MGNLHGRMPTKGNEIREHDSESGAKRVIGRISGNTVSYEDTNFATGDSPAVLDVETDIGRKGYRGSFTNDGPGDIKVEVSHNGTAYGGQHTLHGGETLSLNDLTISKIRLTWVDNVEYRAIIG